jgi:uncharacterized membrane protein
MTARVRWLLVASLALNLVFATALGTWLLTHRMHGGSGSMWSTGFPSPRALHRHLHEAERVQLREALEQHRPAFRQQARQARKARKDVQRALLAEPFQRAALEEAMQRVRLHSGGLAEHAQQAIVDLAAGMDSDGRQRLAEALRRGDRQHPRHGDRSKRNAEETEPPASRSDQ